MEFYQNLSRDDKTKFGSPVKPCVYPKIIDSL